MSNLAKEIIDVQQTLAKDRSTLDSHCQEIADVMLPRQNNFWRTNQTEGEKRNQNIVSSVAQNALEKFASILEYTVAPRYQSWHKLQTTNTELNKIHEVSLYYDQLNDFLQSKRYSGKSTFSTQLHETLTSLGAFGTGVLVTTEDLDSLSVNYKSSHLSENFFMQNDKGNVDVNYRLHKMTARQAVMFFGEDKLPEKIKKAADRDPREKFEFIHLVKPNEDIKPSAKDYRSKAFSSYHVSIEGNVLLKEGGYNTMPYHITRYTTAPNEIYGRSPGMTALSEVKMVNAMRKTDLRARHLNVSPPIMTSDGVSMSRPIIKPDAINRGYLDENGNPRMKPFLSGANIGISNDTLDQSYSIINDIFLVTLFKIAVETPQMTATEVLERAAEKGALLAPSAGRIQSELLSPLISREIDIYVNMGMIPPPPQVLIEAQDEFEVEYISPLNVMQKSGEAAAASQILNDMVALAQFNPQIMNKIDYDGYVAVMREARGAPSSMFLPDEAVAEINRMQQEQAAEQAEIENAPALAGGIKDLAEAEATANA